MKDSVTVHIDAPVEAVWDLVSDVTRIGEFSPETLEAEWLDGHAGPAESARFRGRVKRNGKGPTYWSSCRVTECDPLRAFGFAVLVGDKPVNNWRYVLTAAGNGTDVTESFALEPTVPNRVYWMLLGRWRGKTNREGMRSTLERMKAVLERA